jgi:hypothetical protein
MTDAEKLNAIADKCRAYLSRGFGPRAEAGWRTTLAAIAEVEDMDEVGAAVLSANIISAWEGLL